MIIKWKGNWVWSKESDVFGLLFLGDGATISRIPPLKILVSGGNLPVAVL